MADKYAGEAGDETQKPSAAATAVTSVRDFMQSYTRESEVESGVGRTKRGRERGRDMRGDPQCWRQLGGRCTLGAASSQANTLCVGQRGRHDTQMGGEKPKKKKKRGTTP